MFLRQPTGLDSAMTADCRDFGYEADDHWAKLPHSAGAGRKSIRAYSYGTKTYEYYHCRVCGCVTHYARINVKRTDRVAVNACMMNPEGVASIPIRRLDVRKRERGKAEPSDAADRGGM